MASEGAAEAPVAAEGLSQGEGPTLPPRHLIPYTNAELQDMSPSAYDGGNGNPEAGGVLSLQDWDAFYESDWISELEALDQALERGIALEFAMAEGQPAANAYDAHLTDEELMLELESWRRSRFSRRWRNVWRRLRRTFRRAN
jgi:hypothetical protein